MGERQIRDLLTGQNSSRDQNEAIAGLALFFRDTEGETTSCRRTFYVSDWSCFIYSGLEFYIYSI